jgi:hypothetical protein
MDPFFEVQLERNNSKMVSLAKQKKNRQKRKQAKEDR